ncbi:hypothetical protein V496_05104 [Pseudogymnoascus sp. VKM F-4515 (FW-2607)]|nr:hypothetical protein V496_05104 [Pseudogymnoascus sp. VKM F-4515 (FW-2607)]
MSHPKASRGHRPSPLAQEVHLRPVSELPNLSVADPIFWKRFSAAIHEAEGADVENGRARSTSASTGESMDKPGDDWLVRQRQKKRRCRVISWGVALSVVLLITAVAVVAWYFTAGPGKADGEA